MTTNENSRLLGVQMTAERSSPNKGHARFEGCIKPMKGSFKQFVHIEHCQKSAMVAPT